MGPAETLGSSQQWALRKYLNSEIEHQGSLSGGKIYVRRKLAYISSVTSSRGNQTWKLGCRGRNLVSERLKK